MQVTFWSKALGIPLDESNFRLWRKPHCPADRQVEIVIMIYLMEALILYLCCREFLGFSCGMPQWRACSLISVDMAFGGFW